MTKAQLAEILELPIAERVELVQSIWDSVSEAPAPAVSDAERELIDRRLEAHRENPGGVSSWPEVKERILRRT